ncbi:MAG TPA: ABC transporter substrate-binding protein [Azonexus sp.]|nr:ABC transporter substrate-binding protein [Azonexus sp.]
MSLGRVVLVARKALIAGFFGVLWAASCTAEEYFDKYGLAPASAPLDLGIQPLGYPSGLISAVMHHDRILKNALIKAGHPLQTHAFRRGADMVKPLADRRLEAGLLGDMPTILAAASGSIWIVGLVKQTSTAIVAKGGTTVRGLAGKRIAYVETSSAHHTLLQGLSSAGLKESEVKLVTMGIDAMPEALERGEIDAFAAWEPGPSVALGNSEKNSIVFRGQSTDYFVIERNFATNSPEASDALIAGYVRAIEWMRRSQKNIELAARWANADAEALSGKPGTLPVAQIVAITRREILNVPSAPAILTNPNAAPPLKTEFDFLNGQKKIPASGQWKNVETALSFNGLARIMAENRKFQLSTFDYAE